ncbi:branched-chain amino acid ABC transporter permease [Microbacterium kribbense]|uniref:Branched-chain amino acid ABC transporter permease n=1 Tax=Microbacterium kribbense TaxID=433645 RepID=A0ABP7G687_9MICO
MISDLLQSLFSGLALGALYSIVGIGFVIIYRVTGVANLTQGALVALGAYVMSSVAGLLPWALAVLVSLLVTAAAAAFVGLAVLTGRSLGAHAPLIMTLGLAIAFQGVFILIWGDLPVSYPPLISAAFRVGGAFILPQQVLLLAVVLVLFVLLQMFFSKSYLGKALTAASSNPHAAQLVGVELLKMGTIAFAVSGAVAGLTGAIFGALVPMTPEAHIAIAIPGFAAAIIGNMRSPVGAMIGGLVLGQVTSAVAVFGLPEYQQTAALAVLILVLLVRAALGRRGGELA